MYGNISYLEVGPRLSAMPPPTTTNHRSPSGAEVCRVLSAGDSMTVPVPMMLEFLIH